MAVALIEWVRPSDCLTLLMKKEELPVRGSLRQAGFPAFGLGSRRVSLEIKAQIHAPSEGSRIATFFFTPFVQYLIFVAKDLGRHIREIPPISVTSRGAQGTFLSTAANP